MNSIYLCLKNGSDFMSSIYSHGLWLKREDVCSIVASGYKFLNHYLEAATLALEQRKTRFRITPKMHAFMHLLEYMVSEINMPKASYAQNVVAYSCQQDEDFCGRVAMLSCAVSSRTCHRQVMARYATNLWEHWGKWEA